MEPLVDKTEKLFQSIQDGNTTEALQLLDDKAIQKDINATVIHEKTFLCIASENGNVDVVQKLLTIPGLNIHKGSPLSRATSNNRTAIVKKLLEAGANISRYDYTEVHKAASRGYTETLEAFLDKYPELISGAVNKKSSLKKDVVLTPLYCASVSGRMKTVRMLVERGADLFITSNGETAYDAALEYKHADVAAYLQAKMEAAQIKDNRMNLNIAALAIQCNKQKTEINKQKTDIANLKQRVGELEAVVQQYTPEVYGSGKKQPGPQDERLLKTWRKMHIFAIKYLNVSVRHRLFEMDLLTPREMEQITRRLDNKGNEDACEYMLQMLTRNVHTNDKFQKFLSAMEKDKQKQVMKKYESAYNSFV